MRTKSDLLEVWILLLLALAEQDTLDSMNLEVKSMTAPEW
jgi:hypothetical protein